MMMRTLASSCAHGAKLTSLARQQLALPPTSRSMRVVAQAQKQQEQATENGLQFEPRGDSTMQMQRSPRSQVQQQGQGQQGGVARRRDVAPYRMNDLLNQMQREMDTMMSVFDAPFLSSDFGRPFAMLDRLPIPAMPALPAASLHMDVTEDEKNYYVHAEVPGFTKDQIKVSVSHDHVLTLSGEVKEEDTDGDGKNKPRRMRVSSFVRRLQLPEDAHEDHIQATTKDGVLSVTVPKAEKKQPRVKEIPVA